MCNAKAYPGADSDSDHNLVVAKLRAKLKKVLKATVRQRSNEGTAMNYRCEIDTGAVTREAGKCRRKWQVGTLCLLLLCPLPLIGGSIKR